MWSSGGRSQSFLGDLRANSIETPGGGAPPPTHSWRTCARGLVLAGVLGVLGSLGILATNLRKIVPEPVQIEPRGLKNRAWGFQNRAWSLPRRYFLKAFNLRKQNIPCPKILWGQNGELGFNSMCCARTAALQDGHEKQQVNASRVFLQQSLRHVQKCRQERNMCQHMANWGLQNRGWSAPSREKNDQKARQMQQAAKNAPKKRLRPKKEPK